MHGPKDVKLHLRPPIQPPQKKLFIIHFYKANTVHYKANTVHYKANTVHYKANTVHYKANTVHYKANTVHFKTYLSPGLIVHFKSELVYWASQLPSDSYASLLPCCFVWKGNLVFSFDRGTQTVNIR